MERFVCAANTCGKYIIIHVNVENPESPTGEIISIWTMAGLGLPQKEIDEVYSGLMWGEGYFGQKSPTCGISFRMMSHPL